MTTDEIIDLAHKAGTLFVTQFGVASVTVEWLENFAGLVADAEREAIIQAIPGGHYVDPQWVCDMIRARGGTNEAAIAKAEAV